MVLWNRVHCAGTFHWQNTFMQIICWENSFVLLSELKVHNIRDESHLRTLLITSPGYNFNLWFDQKWWRNEKYLRIVRDGFVDNLNMCLYQRYKSSFGHFSYKILRWQDSEVWGQARRRSVSNMVQHILTNKSYIHNQAEFMAFTPVASGQDLLWKIHRNHKKNQSKSELSTPDLFIWMWPTCTNSLRAGIILFIFQLENIQMWNRTYS